MDEWSYGRPADMLSVEEAQEKILSRIEPLAPIELPLTDAFGCVLAEDLRAPTDLPAFPSSAMDGFAVRAADVGGAGESSPVFLRVVGSAEIGKKPKGVVGPGEGMRIATGAPIPVGADAVVPVEEARATEDGVEVLRPAPPARHLRPAGEDVRTGEVLVPAGRRIGAPELGLLASAGLPRLPVHPRPRVVVVSTGDELVEPGRPLAFGQIHESNGYTLVGCLKEAGAQPSLAGTVPDDPEKLMEEVVSHLATADVFISTGGVSVGERDPVKAAFRDRGQVVFYRAAMQPGMPQAFGIIDGKPFFGLPGNPVSVFVSFEVFVRPALMKMMSRRELFRPQLTARLDSNVPGKHDKTVFARVRVKRSGGGWTATPTGGRGSNLMSTVVRANGLAVVPAGVTSLPAGAECRVAVFRSLEE